jgi:hypothetical protein
MAPGPDGLLPWFMGRTTGRTGGGTRTKMAASWAALQVRWRCAVWMGVDGRARPGEVLMMVASKLKLPMTEIR